MEHILTHSSFVEISVLSDCNVYHQVWLLPSFTGQPDESNLEIYSFALLADLELVIHHPARNSDCLGDLLNILGLFLTSHPSAFSVTLYSPLDSPNHTLILIFCLGIPIQPLDSPKR